MDRDYSISDFAIETIGQMIADCKRFQDIAYSQGECFEAYYIGNATYSAAEYAGHDFWLTRNHHGSGFWDGDWEESAGELLTALAHSFGECDLYVCDDDQIYLSRG